MLTLIVGQGVLHYTEHVVRDGVGHMVTSRLKSKIVGASYAYRLFPNASVFSDYFVRPKNNGTKASAIAEFFFIHP